VSLSTAQSPTSTELAKPSLLEIAWTFAVISSISFGGGQKASVRRQVVTDQRWIDDAEFIEGLEIAQVMPGPNILNLAIFCAQRARGIPGAIVATFAVSIPCFVIVLIVGALYFKFIGNSLVHAALAGCAAGALGLTVGNAFELSAEQRSDPWRYVLIAVTAVLVARFKFPLVLTLAIFGGIGIWREYVVSKRKEA
jgi:chromate transporter